jgi:NTE family protein
MITVGVALGGGSSKGLCHIGVLKALEEEGIPIGCISGTSMGAIVGAIYSVTQDVALLEKRTEQFTSSKTFKDLGLSVFKREKEGRIQKIVHMIKEKLLFAEALFKPYLVKEDEIIETLNRIIPDIQIQDTKIPFSTVSLDLLSGCDIVKMRGTLRDAVMTSMAIPGLFPYSEEDGYVLVDGGPTSSVPVHATQLMGADVIVAVTTRGDIKKTKIPKTGLEIHLRIDEIVTTRLLEDQTRKADVVVRPDVHDVHWADFSRLGYCIERGYDATMREIPKIKRAIRRKAGLGYRLRKVLTGKKKEYLYLKVPD